MGPSFNLTKVTQNIVTSVTVSYRIKLVSTLPGVVKPIY